MDNKINRTTYLENLKIIRQEVVVLRRYLAASTKEGQELTAKTRLLLKDVPVLFSTAIQIRPQYYSDKFKARIPRELENVKKEIEDNIEASNTKRRK